MESGGDYLFKISAASGVVESAAAAGTIAHIAHQQVCHSPVSAQTVSCERVSCEVCCMLLC